MTYDRRVMRIVVIALVVMGLGAQSASAQARDKAAADKIFADGQQRYAAGEYLTAAEKFVAAYELDPDPAYLFNIAQAYRLGNACAKAAKYYREFLGAVSSAPNLAKVQQYIEQSDACAKTQQPLPTEPVIVTQPVEPAPPVEAPAPADPGRTKRYLGVGSIMVGVVAVGAGAYFSVRVGTLLTERDTLCTLASPCTNQQIVDQDQEGKDAQRNSIIAYSVGGVALVAGVALYVLNRSTDETKPSFAIVPTSDGAMATGAFRF